MVEPGVTFAAAINAAVVVLLLGALVLAYRRLTGGDTEAADEAWFDEAISLAREVQETAGNVEEPVDHDRLQRDILPLASRLRGHARAAPTAVDARIPRQLHALSVDCYALGMEHTTRRAARTGVFIEEELDALRADAVTLEATIEPYLDDG